MRKVLGFLDSTLTINDDKEIYLGAPKNLKKKKLNIHYCNALVRRVTKDIDDDKEIYLGAPQAPQSLDRISIFHARAQLCRLWRPALCTKTPKRKNDPTTSYYFYYSAASTDDCQMSIALVW